MDREKGYYWVRTCDDPDTQAIAEWNGERFLLAGSNTGWFPEEMEEIGGKIEADVTEEMVTRAINALVYTGYNDQAQIKVIRRQASCREYVRAALEAALSTPK